MTLRPRRWAPSLGLTVVLALAIGGATTASAAPRTAPAATHSARASQAAAARLLAARLALRPSASTTCSSVRARRAQLVAQGHSRAMCIQQARVKKSRATSRLSGRPSARVKQAGLFCPINRFEICTNFNGVINVIDLNNGQLVGQEFYSLQQDIQMNPNSLTFAENYNMNFTNGFGNIAGMTVSLAVTCGQFCSAFTNFLNPAPAPVGGSFGGAISYSDFPPLGIDRTHSTYTLTAAGPGLPGVGVSQSQTYRCDTISGISPGCVNPGYWPTLFTMVSLPTIAASIRNVQSFGPHH
jgi:hypothetical protein